MRGKALITFTLSAALAMVAVGCKSGNHDLHDDDGKTKTIITANDVPAVVQRGFDKAYPNVTVKEIIREKYKDGTIHYEYKYVAADGKVREVELDESGEVLEHH